MDADQTTITRQTTAVAAADGSGIDLLHADVERDTDGRILFVEPAEQEWIDFFADHSDNLTADAFDLLVDHGWRVVGRWQPTEHEGGYREAVVERLT